MKPARLRHATAFHASLAVLLFLLITPLPASAASADEIIEMNNAGLSAQIIIEVIDATGFDDPLDSDTFIYLLEYDVDYEVIEYLLEFAEDDDKLEVSAHERWGSEPEEHPNYAGGPGFNHERDEYRSSGTGYWNGYDDYYERGQSADYYYDNGVTVYRPPVYVYSGRNNYYNDPYGYYSNNYGSGYSGTYRNYYSGYNNSYNYPYDSTYGGNRHYYDDYWNDRDWDYNPHYNDPWRSRRHDGYGRYTGMRGQIRYNRFDDRWYSDWDAFYRSNNFGIRISF